MTKLGLKAGVVAVAAATATIVGPALAATSSVARCALEVQLAFSEPIAPLGAPVQEVAIITVTPGEIRCEGDFAGAQLVGAGSASVSGTFTGTCLGHRATGTYSFSHPTADGSTITGAGEFTNHRAADRTALEVHGADHAGAGTANAAVNGNPCRQPFDRALFVADLIIESH